MPKSSRLREKSYRHGLRNFQEFTLRQEGRLRLLQVLFWCGWIAQLVEQAIENRCVPSSILGPATTSPS